MQEIQEIDYKKLNKTQKMALFLITVGPESAAEIIKDFEDTDLEKVCREMANFKIIGAEIQEKIAEDFAGIISESLGAVLGGNRYTQKALELAKGEYRASSILSRIAPGSSTTDIMSEISDMEPLQIFNLIRQEQPQTIAFIISNLRLEKAADLIAMLDEQLRDEVVERMGAMESTSIENITRVVYSFQRHISRKKPTLHLCGGIRRVADILNSLGKELSKSIIARLEEKNPKLCSNIRRKMFGFDDLIRLQKRDISRITREVEMNDLIVAMKQSSQQLIDIIFASVSKRAAETMKEEMEMLGTIRYRAIEAAQDRIMQVVRRLEEEGEIVLDDEDENESTL